MATYFMDAPFSANPFQRIFFPYPADTESDARIVIVERGVKGWSLKPAAHDAFFRVDFLFYGVRGAVRASLLEI